MEIYNYPKRLSNTQFLITLILIIPIVIFAQPPPPLGTSSTFALFTASGAFNNDGATMITGDIGSNVGGVVGFPPGNVTGTIHESNVTSASAATDVMMAYSYLSGVTCGTVLSPTLGEDQILTPDVYCIGSAASLTGDLILNAVGDPDAVFIIKINGALSTATNSNIILTGMASLCNVYWQINGAYTLGEGSVFRGTVLVNGAIELLEASSLIGQGLTQAGAISTHNNVVTIGERPMAATIAADGPISFCEGNSVTLSGNINGTWNTGATTPSIVVNTSGDYFVTNTNNCGVISSNHIIVGVSPLGMPTITPDGPTTFCTGDSVILTSSAADNYMWNTGDVTQSITVMNSGMYNVTVTTAGNCADGTSATTEVTVNQTATPTITANGPTTFCEGESVTLTSSPAGSYLWSTGAMTQSITVFNSGGYSVETQNGDICASRITKVVVIQRNFVHSRLFLP